MKKQHEDYEEEFAPEISPGYRQDVRKEETSSLTPLLVILGIFVFIVLLLISRF